VTAPRSPSASSPNDRLGPEQFFSEHGFAPTTTYELIWEKRRYPPKAILGTAYELATGKRLASGDFEGGKTGAVKVLGELGFNIQPKPAAHDRRDAPRKARPASKEHGARRPPR
jgi:hypothetical protein